MQDPPTLSSPIARSETPRWLRPRTPSSQSSAISQAEKRSKALLMPPSPSAGVTIETITFDAVTFGYEPDHVAVGDFTLDAKRGDVIVLAGPSGAGKSTVVNLLLRLYDPRSGGITIDGRDLRDFTVESLRRGIAVVPQDVVLFNESIGYNLRYGRHDASDEEVRQAARRAQIHDAIERMPQVSR